MEIVGLYYDGGYIDWQIKRVTYLIELFGLEFFKGKNVLELGSYEGGITQLFHNLGCNIIGIEGSNRNINISRQRYPHITFIQLDCDKNIFEHIENTKFDIIIHWGLLYHLKFPKESILNCLKHTKYIFLESIIVDKTEPEIYFKEEDNVNLPDQSLNGLGARPTASYVEKILNEEDVEYERHDNEKLNSKYQPDYNWIETNTGEEYRRFWIIKKKE